MGLRAIFSLGLAIAFPVVSLIGIRGGVANPFWLALPDALICLALIQGLRGDSKYVFALSGLALTSILSFIDSTNSPLFSALIFALIARYFERTLEPFQTPLITQMARRIRGPDLGFSEDAFNYTRKLTRIWSLFFVLLGVNQVILVIATRGTWALMMGNSLAPALILIFLAFEPIYRRYRLPNEPRHAFRHFLTRLLETDWKTLR